MNLLDQFKDFLFSQKDKPSAATVKNYIADIRHFIAWFELNQKQSFKPELVDIQILNAFKIQSKNKLSAASVERHLSSLRKFFGFLKLEGQVPSSPFEEIISSNQTKPDPFHLKEFKDFLYVYNSSNLTIKNYLIDIKQFLSWAEEVTKPQEAWLVADKNIFTKISPELVEEYKNRLIAENVFSPSSINRKLSSLRRYLSWAESQNLIASPLSHQDNPNNGFTNAVTRDLQLPVEGFKNNVILGTSETRTSESDSGQSRATSYSSFPPLRLAQKISKGIGIVSDALLVNPFVFIFEKIEDLNWKASGKKIFSEGSKINDEGTINRVSFKPFDKLRVSNIPKSVFAPLAISIASFPFHKKVIHHIRYTRPNWYKRYHSYAISHYFNFAILVIFMSILGFAIYQNFFGVNQLKKLLASQPQLPQAPLRILSFQGRLTDNSDNPITTPTWLRFIIYSDSAATGSARLWEEERKVSPDQDGIFNVLMGSDGAGGAAALCNGNSAPASPATGACGIMPTLFSQYNQLWLGVSVEQTAELAPRQQLATVAFASNSETLQGLPPITQSGAGQTNVVLALDSSGNLTIGGSATPTFTASGGKFTISGNVLSLQTVSGSNSNIQLIPDGSGIIDLQKPLQNTTLNNNITSAAGAVEVDDLLAILATSSGQSALTINQNGAGPLISASTGGAAKFTVDNSGNTSIAGSLTLSGNVLSDLIPNPTNTYSLGNASHQWLNLYAQNIYENGQLLTGNLWQRNLGVLSPTNITDDLILGSTSTTSGTPIFAFLNVAAGTPTASISSNLSLKVPTGASPANTLNLLNGGTLGVYTASSGQFDAGLNANPTLFVANNSRVGIGTNNPTTVLNVNGGSFLAGGTKVGGGGTYSSSYGLTIESIGDTTPTLLVDKRSGTQTANLIDVGVGNGSLFTITAAGNTGIGATSPLATLDVRGNSGTTSVASVSGSTSFASLVANNDGVGDVFTASSSSIPLFVIKGNGRVGIGTTAPAYPLDVNGNAEIEGTRLFVGGTTYFIAGDNSASNLYALQLNKSSGTGYTTPDIFGGTNGLVIGGLSGGNGTIALNSSGGSTPTVYLTGSTIGINTTSPLATLDTRGNSASTPVASISGNTNKASLVVNNDGSGDILTGSSSGTTQFYFTKGGSLYARSFLDLDNTNYFLDPAAGGTSLYTAGKFKSDSYNNNGGVIWGDNTGILQQTTVGSSGQCLQSSGGGAPTWGNCSGSGGVSGFWRIVAGALSPVNDTLDVLIGANSTGSAKFGFLNVNSGTPTASISASTTKALALDANGLIQTFSNENLTLGGTQSGNITLTPKNGTGTVTFTGYATGVIHSVSGLLSSSAVDLSNGSTDITNTLSTSNGGTGQNTYGVGDMLFYASGSTLSKLTIGTANYVLTSTGTAPQWSSGLSLPGNLSVSGSLTADLIPSGNGSINLGSPSHYYNVVYADSFSSPTGNGVEGFWTVTNNTNLFPTNYAADDLLIGGNATGSATPFQIFAATNAATFAVAGSATTSGGLTFRGNTTKISLLNNTTLGFYNSVGGDSALSANPNLYISNAGNSGYIGINTSTPTSPLQISVNSSSTPDLLLGSGTAVTNYLSFSAGGAMFGYDNAIGNAAITSGTNKGIAFYTGGTDGSFLSGTEQMFLNNSGNLGLGLTNQVAKLQVNGSASVSADLTFYGAGTTHNIYDFNQGNLDFQTSPGGAVPSTGVVHSLYIQGGTGYVGHGTTNPGTKLDIAGTQQSSLSPIQQVVSNNAVAIDYARGGSGGYEPGYIWYATDNQPTMPKAGIWMQDTNSGSYIQLGTSNLYSSGITNTALTINYSGNVGINDTNPTDFLLEATGHVGPSATNTYDLGSAALEWRNLYVQQVISPVGGGVAGYWQLNSGVLSPTNIFNDVAVGGLATGSATFQVFGQSSFQGTKPVATISANTSFAALVVDNKGKGDLITASSSGQDRFVVKQNGNVGIGIDSPANSLQIAGDFQVGKDTTLWMTSPAGYGYRRQITIENSSGGALSNYQVKIVMDTASLITAGKMQSSACNDLQFTDQDGQTTLPYWIESGCNTNYTTIWVKVPTIGYPTKTIYAYYGASSQPVTSSTLTTFTASISAVQAAYRLDEPTYDPVPDYSTNNNVATASGTTIINANNGAKFNNARTFNGTSDYIAASDSASLRQATPMTASVWLKFTSTTQDMRVLAKDTASGTRYLYSIGVNPSTTVSQCSSGTGKIFAQYFNGTNFIICGNTTYNDGNWHFVAMTITGTTLSIAVDGKSQGTVTISGTQNPPTGEFDLGADPASSAPSNRSNFFNGTLDEMRLYSASLSASQVTTLYGNGGQNYGYVTTQLANTELVAAFTKTPPSFVINPEQSTLQTIPSFYVQNSTGNVALGTLSVASTSARLTIAGDLKSGLYDPTPWSTTNFVGYQYRSRVLVDNSKGSTALSNYDVRIDVYTTPIISDGKMRSDCGDMRFADSDGESSLSYWIETGTCNTLDTVIWVKVPTIPSSDTKNIYMYYGNPSVTSNSNSNLFIDNTISGVKGAWRLDETSGTNVADYSGNNNTGTATGTIIQGGYANNARFFNGSTDYVSVNDSASLQQATPLSVAAWFNTSMVSTATTCLVRKDTTSGTRYLYGLSLNSDSKIHGTYFNGSVFDSVSNSTLNDGKWHYAVMTISGTTNTLYIDGTAQTTTATITGTQGVPTGEMDMGACPPNTGGGRSAFWNGALDEVRVYNTALSSTQITHLYNSRTGYGYVTTNSAGNEYARPFNNPEPPITVDSEQDPSQVDPTLYVNNTFNMLGVNTANPTASLDVEGNTNINPTLLVNQSGSADILAASSSGSLQFKLTNGGSIYTRSFLDLDNPSYFLDPAAAGTSLAVAGSVGIGTTSPVATLANTNTVVEDVSTTNCGNCLGINWAASNTGYLGAFYNSNSGASANGFLLKIDGTASTNRILELETGSSANSVGTEVMTVLGNGNVGIGTTSPTNAGLVVATTVGSTQAQFGTNMPIYMVSPNSDVGFNLYVTGGAWKYGTSNGGAVLSIDTAGAYEFWTAPSGTAGNTATITERAYLSQGGHFSVNGADGTYPFHVFNDSAGNAFIIGTGGDANFYNGIQMQNGTSNTIYYGSNGVNEPNSGSNTGEKIQLWGTLASPNAAGDYALGIGSGELWENSAGAYEWWTNNGGLQKQLSLTSGGILRARGTITGNTTPDAAEKLLVTDPSINAGDIISVDPVATESGTKSKKPYDPTIIGAVSTKPGLLLNGHFDDNLNEIINPMERPLVLAGRIPLKVSTINGPIQNGDSITSSILPGIGMKATKAGQIVAKAYYPFNPDPNTCIPENSIDAIPWSTNPDDNDTTNCYKLPDGTLVGKIIAALNVSSYDPTMQLADTSGYSLISSSSGVFQIVDSAGNIVDRVGLFAQAMIANLQAGTINAQEIATNSLAIATDNMSIAGQSLRDYILSVVRTSNLVQNGTLSPIADVDQIHTNLISPLASDSAIAVDLENSQFTIRNNASGSAVARIDNQGNATFSGQLNSQLLAVNGDATISGTLHVNQIQANQIEGLSEVVSTLSAQNITNVNNIYFATPSASPTPVILGSEATPGSGFWTSQNDASGSANFASIASYSAYLAYVPSLHATTALFDQGIVSLGPTSLADTSIVGQLSINGSLILADNSVNVLGANFNVQPLRQGGVSFEGGLIAIDTDGNLTVDGKAVFNNTLAVNIISPLANDKNVNIQLGQNSPATGSALATSTLNVQNASGSGIFNIDQLGNVIASGTATFGKLNLSLAQPALALSDTEVVATGSAGQATVKAHQSEVTIDNPLVTQNSLIYITPVGSSVAQTPYLMRQITGQSFTVGISSPGIADTNFNWLIVN